MRMGWTGEEVEDVDGMIRMMGVTMGVRMGIGIETKVRK